MPPPITLTKLRDLTLAASSAADRPAYLSAASGLVRVGAFLYVIADDENHLGVFRTGDDRPGALVTLRAGDLPAAPKARKKAKPDFEALTLLPPFAGYAHGALLAAGSGSKPNRHKGALLGLDAAGALQGAVRAVDLEGLFAAVARDHAALNIEGMAVIGPELRLFQRGNKKDGTSAMIAFPLDAALRALCDGADDTLAPVSQRPFDLGAVNGVPLHFTDAAPLPTGEIVFTAVAEDTDNPYDDGLCAGAAIGLIGVDGTLRWMRPVADTCKVEGVHATINGDALDLLLVTDADDVTVRASLLSGRVPR